VARPKSSVTGGCGFIGSHVVDHLVAAGHDVVVIDNFSTGRPENLAHHRGTPHVRVVQADVADTKRIVPELAGVRWMFHVAALADIVPSIQYPEAYVRANVMGTLGALEAAREVGVEAVQAQHQVAAAGLVLQCRSVGPLVGRRRASGS